MREILEKDRAVGRRIAELRKSLKMSQQEFAERVGLTRSFVSQVECGCGALSARSCRDICRTFAVSLEWLMEGTGELFAPATKEEAIADLFADVLNGDPYKNRIIAALSLLSLDEWRLLVSIAEKISGANSEE